MITIPMSLYTFLAFYFPMPFFLIVPVFRSDECRIIQVGMNYSIIKYQITINEIVFLFVNWLELAYLYYTWMKLKRVKQDQLNIKNEIQLITIWWIGFSFIYFIFVLLPDMDQSNYEAQQFIIIAGMVGIQARNIFTFLTQTLLTLHQVYSKKQVEYGNDFLRGKLKLLDLNIIMNHQLTF